jgi:hypothetical protein
MLVSSYMSPAAIVIGLAVGVAFGLAQLWWRARRRPGSHGAPIVVDVPADGPCPIAGCTGHPPSTETITVGRASARNFRVGMAIVYDDKAGVLRRETWHDRLRARLRRRLLWWRQVRYETIAVDVAAGRMTQVRLRWSWRRWRWLREDYVFSGGEPGSCIEGLEEDTGR